MDNEQKSEILGTRAQIKEVLVVLSAGLAAIGLTAASTVAFIDMLIKGSTGKAFVMLGIYLLLVGAGWTFVHLRKKIL